jgi:3-methyladenine DNA glycosylase AlkC
MVNSTIEKLLKEKADQVESLFHSVSRMDSETLYLIATLLRSSGHFNETSTALQKELVRIDVPTCDLLCIIQSSQRQSCTDIL